MSRNARRSASMGPYEMLSINSSQDPILSNFTPLSPLPDGKKKTSKLRRAESLCANPLNQDDTSSGIQAVARDRASRHRGSRARYIPEIAIPHPEGESRKRPIVITSDDDDDVGHNNNDNDDDIILPKLEIASPSGSPSSFHDLSRVNLGRRDSSRASNRSRTPSRGRTRYRFNSVHGASNMQYPRPSSKDAGRERSRTKELSTPILGAPALQDPQRQTSRAGIRRMTQQNSNRNSSEKMTGGSESPVLGEAYMAGERHGCHQDEQQDFIPKGAFLVRKEPNSDQYRFPKASAKPQSPWVAGDGFSDAEANPNFMFIMTGKRKRRISPSLPGMGKLATGMDGTKSSTIRVHGKRARRDGAYQQNSGLLRGERRDVWPTRHDFIESTLPRRGKQAVGDCSTDVFFVPNTVLSPPTTNYEPQSTLKLGHWKGKGPLDFRNFETEEVAKSSLLGDLRRVRAWRDESSPCPDEAADEDGDALEMSDLGSQASGPIDTGNEDEDDDSFSTGLRCSDKPYWDRSSNYVFQGDTE